MARTRGSRGFTKRPYFACASGSLSVVIGRALMIHEDARYPALTVPLARLCGAAERCLELVLLRRVLIGWPRCAANSWSSGRRRRRFM